MKQFEAAYANLITRILDEGEPRVGRNGGTRALFGETLTIDMSGSDQFPLLMGRRIYHKGVFGEFAAMIRGPHHLDDFEKWGCNYWKDWAQPNGYINVDYGNAWLNFGGVNQLTAVKDKLINNPTDRRMIITGWNPANLDSLDLPCCHILYQWFVRDGIYLDMIWYQRSVDTMIGLPSDIILAALFNILLASDCGYEPGKLIFNLGDTHIYEEHVENARVYVNNVKGKVFDYPNYWLSTRGPIEQFEPGFLQIEDYYPIDKLNFELKK